MKLISAKDIVPRVLIKKLNKETKSKAGLFIPSDNDELPKAEIVMVSESAKDVVSVGDTVYYIENTRDMGRCKFKGKEHFAIPIGQLVAII